MARAAGAASTGLSTYREGSLHAALKALYARPGDRVEHAVDGYVIDIARDDELVEIQTASFASAARKLRKLVATHRIVLVHPIALERWLIRVDADGVVTDKRRSPKRGQLLDLFRELTAFPELVAHPNFRLELVLIHEEEIRGPVPEGARYRHPRTWWRLDRRLVEVVRTVRVDVPSDLLALLPLGMPGQFTTGDIAAASRRPKNLAMRTAYCLQGAGAARLIGKRGAMKLYEPAEAMEPAEAAEPPEAVGGAEPAEAAGGAAPDSTPAPAEAAGGAEPAEAAEPAQAAGGVLPEAD